jgi:hypothetical protein
LLVGERGHLIPNAYLEYLTDGYVFVGRLIAHAVANGCHGLCGLSPAVQQYLLHWPETTGMEDWLDSITLDDVDEKPLHDLLNKVVNFIRFFYET